MKAIRDVFPDCLEYVDPPHVIYNFKKVVRKAAKANHLNPDDWGDRCSKDLWLILCHCFANENEENLQRRLENMLMHYTGQHTHLCLHAESSTSTFASVNKDSGFYSGLSDAVQNLVSKIDRLWAARGTARLSGLHCSIAHKVPKGTFFKVNYAIGVAIAIGQYDEGFQFYQTILRSFGFPISARTNHQLNKLQRNIEKDHNRKASEPYRIRKIVLKRGKKKQRQWINSIPKRLKNAKRQRAKTKKRPGNLLNPSVFTKKVRHCHGCGQAGHDIRTCPNKRKEITLVENVDVCAR